MLHDWHQFHLSDAATPAVVDSRRRLRICLVGFAVLAAVVFGRAVQLEVSQGPAFRDRALRPLRIQRSLPGVRGRILARDGTLLACDKQILVLAVEYRYLQDPPDAGWLRRTARARLTGADRKDPERIAAAEARLRAERTELARRLAELGGMSPEEFRRRCGRIHRRVERIAQSVARRRGKQTAIAEQSDHHVVVEDVSPQAAAEIESDPRRYPGVKVLSRTRRWYPCGPLAAHVLGHLGPVTQAELDRDHGPPDYHPEDLIGRMGVERQYEAPLRGRRGTAVELTDHSGRMISSIESRPPGTGRDLVLTLHGELQRTAERLLDDALRRRAIHPQRVGPAGGAIVVMDVGNGELLAAASAPRFDPNLFLGGRSNERAALLADPGHPLFDRVSRMAIAPGSVFKTVSAVALLQAEAVDPHQPFFCRGYLHQPDRQRCAVYRRHGVGHGEVTFGDALALSCNVYFFHHAGELGPGPLVDWAGRFAFGRRSGVDLPGEAAGTLPSPQTVRQVAGHAWRPGDTQSLAIGQGPLTVTPLQVVRMMAAVAGDGRLVTPHVVGRLAARPPGGDGSPVRDREDPIQVPPPRPVPGLSDRTLAAVRAGLRRVVCDPEGTAHGSVHLETVSVAGKTGTAETGGGLADHAWFAGYVPAGRPKLAFVVVLQHAGDAAANAGPVARRLVIRIDQLGLL